MLLWLLASSRNSTRGLASSSSSSLYLSACRPQLRLLPHHTSPSRSLWNNNSSSSRRVQQHVHNIMSLSSSSKDNNTLQSHYESHSSDSYENAFFYEPGAYMTHLQELVQNRLKLLPSSHCRSRRRILDIGGGTGNFTRLLLQNNKKEERINVEAIVIDPFLEHTTTTQEEEDLIFVKESAEAFLTQASDNDWWRNEGFDQILFKEVVHHFNTQDRVDIFRGIYQDLNTNNNNNNNNNDDVSSSTNSSNNEDSLYPSLLIITRPQREIDYPLWPEARQVWAENQPSLEELTNDLKLAGFSNIQHSLEPYPCQISLKRWQTMVKNRFWSTFSNFTNEELEAACETIALTDAIDSNGILHFEDRLLFLSAEKQQPEEPN